MGTYYVNGNLNHDNHEYKPGDPIELEGEVAERHLKSGLVILPEDHEANEKARELEAKAKEARERVSAPKAPDAQAPKPEPTPDKGPGKETREEADGTSTAEQDAEGAEGEEARPDDTLSNAPSGDDL